MPKTTAQTQGCDCYADYAESEVYFCPLHKAAPDLLEAVRELLDNYPIGLDFVPDPRSRIDKDRLAALKIGYAAIAKAEGRE